MITVTVFEERGLYTGFTCSGHAGFGVEGTDIICSAVSALAINTVNSIEALSGSDILVLEERDGYLKATLDDPADEKAQLLMKSLMLGIRSIKESYGTEFIKTKVVRNHVKNEPSVIRS